MSHLFSSDTNGALYDTRGADWSKSRPLRPVFSRTYAAIETTAQLRATLRAGAYAWPGGYPLFFVTADGGALSFKSVRENLREVIGAIWRNDRLSGWRVESCAINWEESELVCDHSGERIESAYAEQEESLDVSKTRLADGAWGIAAMVDGSRVSRVYYFLSESESVDAFREEFSV